LYSFPHSWRDKSGYQDQMASHCVDVVNSYLQKGYKPDEIFILARIINNTDLERSVLRYAEEKNVPITTESRKKNRVHLMSVHKSKGLEARVVIILNVDKGLYGFPSEKEDPDIFATAIMGRTNDKEEEERRLFYVAITRAKDEVIMYTRKSTPSKFLEEIKGHLTVEEVGFWNNHPFQQV
jgi:DNA helicase-4